MYARNVRNSTPWIRHCSEWARRQRKKCSNNINAEDDRNCVIGADRITVRPTLSSTFPRYSAFAFSTGSARRRTNTTVLVQFVVWREDTSDKRRYAAAVSHGVCVLSSRRRRVQRVLYLPPSPTVSSCSESAS